MEKKTKIEWKEIFNDTQPDISNEISFKVRKTVTEIKEYIENNIKIEKEKKFFASQKNLKIIIKPEISEENHKEKNINFSSENKKNPLEEPVPIVKIGNTILEKLSIFSKEAGLNSSKNSEKNNTIGHISIEKTKSLIENINSKIEKKNRDEKINSDIFKNITDEKNDILNNNIKKSVKLVDLKEYRSLNLNKNNNIRSNLIKKSTSNNIKISEKVFTNPYIKTEEKNLQDENSIDQDYNKHINNCSFNREKDEQNLPSKRISGVIQNISSEINENKNSFEIDFENSTKKINDKEINDDMNFSNMGKLIIVKNDLTPNNNIHKINIQEENEIRIEILHKQNTEENLKLFNNKNGIENELEKSDTLEFQTKKKSSNEKIENSEIYSNKNKNIHFYKKPSRGAYTKIKKKSHISHRENHKNQIEEINTNLFNKNLQHQDFDEIDQSFGSYEYDTLNYELLPDNCDEVDNDILVNINKNKTFEGEDNITHDYLLFSDFSKNMKKENINNKNNSYDLNNILIQADIENLNYTKQDIKDYNFEESDKYCLIYSVIGVVGIVSCYLF